MDTERRANCDEQSSNVAVAFCFIGISIIAICFMWPLPEYYVIDPSLSAAENEARQLELIRKQTLLYAMTYLGMTMVTIGGLITAAVMTKTLLQDECGRKSIDDEFEAMRKKPPSQHGAQYIEMTSAISHADNAHLTKSDYLSSNGAGKSYGATGANGAW